MTSGTATLETALFDVPQEVCYETPLPRLVRFAFKHVMSCKYISLVNLIADKEVVQEMFADRFKVDAIADQLYQILPGMEGRERMLAEYREVREGNQVAPDEAAVIMYDLLVKRREMLLKLARERAEAEAKAAAEAAERARLKALAEAEAAKKKAEQEAEAARLKAEKEAELARRRAEEARRLAEEETERARRAEEQLNQSQQEELK